MDTYHAVYWSSDPTLSQGILVLAVIKTTTSAMILTATLTLILSDYLVPFSPVQQYGTHQSQVLPS